MLQQLAKTAISLSLMGSVLGAQFVLPAIKINTGLVAIELGTDKAEAVTAIERQVQKAFNENYAVIGESSSYGFHSKDYDRYLSKTGKLTNFVHRISYEVGKGKSEAETQAAIREALRLYDKYVSKTIEDTASKLYGKHAGKTANMMWRLGVEVYTYTSVRLDGSGSSQQMALFKPMYGKALMLGKLNLDMQAIAYRDELQLLVTKGNANGASVVQFGLEALQRDLKQKGEFSMLPINNIGGGGWLELPSGDISLQPIASNGIQPIGQGSNYYYDMYQQDLKKYRYATVIPDLLEANARGVETMRANGLRQEDSIVFLAATFFDLFFDMAPSSSMGATRRMVASLPEGQLSSIAKSSRNSSRAATMLDNVGGGKKPQTVAQKPKPKQPTRQPICLSSAGTLLMAGISDVEPSLGIDFSDGKTVEIAAAISCKVYARRFLAENPSYVQKGKQIVPANATRTKGIRNSIWKKGVYPAEVIELNMRMNNGQGALNDAQSSAMEVIYKSPSRGVPFDEFGYPIFDDFIYKNDPSYRVTIDKISGDYVDFAKANRKAGFASYTSSDSFAAKQTPKGYTWHHIQNSRQLILIDSNVHSHVGHTGGVSTSGVHGTAGTDGSIE